MRATLVRDYHDSYTLGSLQVGGQEFFTLEPPRLAPFGASGELKENARNLCCIPEGEYELAPLTKSGSGKYSNVFWVKDVPERSGILIHNGNLVKHTKGCILIGMEQGRLVGEIAILASREARDKLWELKPTSIRITSVTAPPPTVTRPTFKQLFDDFAAWLRSLFKRKA